MNGRAGGALSIRLESKNGRLMKRLRILVVDDCLELARTLAQLLRRWGHEVTTATNGRQALEAAGAMPFDAALLDLDVMDMDGFEIAHALRKQQAGDAM